MPLWLAAPAGTIVARPGLARPQTRWQRALHASYGRLARTSPQAAGNARLQGNGGTLGARPQATSALNNRDNARLMSDIKSTQTLASLKQLVDERSGAFDAMAVAAALHRVACVADTSHSLKPELPAAYQPLLNELLRLFRRHLPAYSPRQLSSCLWVLGKLGQGQHSQLLADVLAALFTSSGGASPALLSGSPQDVANTAWALARLRLLNAPRLQVLAAAALPQAAAFKPQELSNLAWAMAQANLQHTELLEAIAQHAAAAAQAKQLRCQHVANLAWAFASLGHYDRRLFAALAAAVMADSRSFNAQALSNLAWAFATVRHAEPGLGQALARAGGWKVRKMSAQGLSNLAWGLSTMGHADQTLLSLVAREAVYKMTELKPLGLSTILWSWAAAGYYNIPLFSSAVPQVLRQLQQGGGNGYSPGSLAKVVWSYAAVGHYDGRLQAAAAAAFLAWAREGALQPADCVAVAQAYAKQEPTRLAVAAKRDGDPAGCLQLAQLFAALGDVVCAGSIGRRPSTREVAMLGWAFASMQAQHSGVQQLLRRALMRRAAEFTPAQLSTSLWAAARLHLMHCSGVEPHAAPLPPLLTPQQLRALQRAPDAGLLRHTLPLLQPRLARMPPAALAQVLWAGCVLEPAMAEPAASQWVAATCAVLVEEGVGGWRPGALTHLLASTAALQHALQQGQPTDSSHDAANISSSSSSSTIKLIVTVTVAAAAEAMQQLPQFTADELSTLLLALQGAGLLDGGVLTALSRQLTVKAAKAPAATVVCCLLQLVQAQAAAAAPAAAPGGSVLCQALLPVYEAAGKALLRRCDGMPPAQLRQVLAAFHAAGYADQAVMHGLEAALLRNSQSQHGGAHAAQVLPQPEAAAAADAVAGAGPSSRPPISALRQRPAPQPSISGGPGITITAAPAAPEPLPGSQPRGPLSSCSGVQGAGGVRQSAAAHGHERTAGAAVDPPDSSRYEGVAPSSRLLQQQASEWTLPSSTSEASTAGAAAVVGLGS